MEDNKLLRLLHKDPNAGMEQLMNQYTGLVYAVVKSKLDDSYYVSSDIEDCVADVFSKFYAELSDYDPKISSIKTYLCVIARNQAINVSKRRSLEGGISLDDVIWQHRVPCYKVFHGAAACNNAAHFLRQRGKKFWIRYSIFVLK